MAEGEQIGVSTNDNAVVAKETADVSKGFTIFYDAIDASFVLFHLRVGQEVFHAFAYTDGAATGSATTVRR